MKDFQLMTPFFELTFYGCILAVLCYFLFAVDDSIICINENENENDVLINFETVLPEYVVDMMTLIQTADVKLPIVVISMCCFVIGHVIYCV